MRLATSVIGPSVVLQALPVPLPGEVVPATFDQAPESNLVYLLQLEQGTWKVVGYNNA